MRRLQNHKDDPHKTFWPLAWGDIVGFSFAAVSLFIAAGGGIGGGGILVPLFILIMGEASSSLHASRSPVLLPLTFIYPHYSYPPVGRCRH